MRRRRQRSPGMSGGGGGDIAQKVAALMAKRAQAQADLDRLEASGETQLSRTDADARLLTKNGQTVAGYNVQIAVDDKHKLIVASEVVNDGNDTGQLYTMAKAAKQALGAETLQAVADVGYYNGATLKAARTTASSPMCRRPTEPGVWQAQGRFTTKTSSTTPRTDAYRCPAGVAAAADEGRKTNTGGRIEIRYAEPQSQPATHVRCAGAVVTDKARRRAPSIAGCIEDVIERHRARMTQAGRTDAPPRRPGRTSLRHAQMPRRLSPLPGARLRQGARRVDAGVPRGENRQGL